MKLRRSCTTSESSYALSDASLKIVLTTFQIGLSNGDTPPFEYVMQGRKMPTVDQTPNAKSCAGRSPDEVMRFARLTDQFASVLRSAQRGGHA